MDDKNRNQIKYGALISYATLIINSVSSLIYLPWMVAIIGKSNYGLYTLANSFISLFLIDFGLSASVARFLSKYNAEGNKEKVHIFVSTVERLYLIIDLFILVALIVLYFCVGNIYSGLSREEIEQFRALYIVVAVYSLISFPCISFSGILNAYEKFVQQKLCELFSKLVSIFLTVIALLLGGNVFSVVVSSAVGGISSIIVKYVIIRRGLKIRIEIRNFDKRTAKEVFSFSIWIMVISLAQRCIFNLAPTMLGIFSNSDEIAVFAPANTLESYFYSISAAVDGLFLPTVSRYAANDETKQISSLFVRIGRYQFLILGLALSEFVCVGKEFIVLWMGEDYIPAYICTIPLFIADILLFTQTIANTTMIAKNEVKKQASGYIIMAVICVALSTFLCRRIGAFGSSVAISVSYIVLFIYMNFQYSKVMKLNVIAFFKKCYLSLGIPMTFSLAVAYGICLFVSFQRMWVTVAVKATIVLGVYCLGMVCFLDNIEKKLIKKVIFRVKCRKEKQEGG